MIRDVLPGSGSWFFTHPGSQIQGSKRHRIPEPQHYSKRMNIKMKATLSWYHTHLAFTMNIKMKATLSRYHTHLAFTYLCTVKVGNFDHLITCKIVLKLFPNTFLTIFLHVLWYFWDPNLKTRFGSQKYHIFKKNVGWSILPLIGLTSTTKEHWEESR
jgi:hypothetical protein